ncbi:OASL1 protein, partial [Podargus strigoides]|nr:OASL1 protein [Podargus strigoides]
LEMVSARELDGWIAESLQPSTDFCMQVKETVKNICDFLKEDCFENNIRVHKTVKGGSAGKGTALQKNSDADVVLFLSYFSSYQKQKQGQERMYILELIKKRLHACRQKLTFTVSIGEPRYKGRGNTPRSISLTLSTRGNLESMDVDVLPAYDALGQVRGDDRPNAEVYVGLLKADPEPGEFSPCFTELQKKFVKRCSPKLKNLLRLVKHWYKEMVKPNCPLVDLPPKYALELLTIYAWEMGTSTASRDSFDTAKGFRTVLELLCQYQEICIYWEKYYSLQDPGIGEHVKKLLCRPRPVILDPADPTGILGQGTRWDLLAEKAASHRSLPCVKGVQPWDVPPARPVNIEVRQLPGTSLSMTVSPSITVWQLKERIQKEWGISPYMQRLALQKPGKSIIVLEDNTLATHSIFYDTTLVLLQTEPQEMEVLVKDDKDRTTTYRVQPTDTVWQLKEKIHSQQGPPANQQRLTCGSVELEDRHTLAHYNIQPRSVIYMLLRLRGGVDP